MIIIYNWLEGILNLDSSFKSLNVSSRLLEIVYGKEEEEEGLGIEGLKIFLEITLGLDKNSKCLKLLNNEAEKSRIETVALSISSAISSTSKFFTSCLKKTDYNSIEQPKKKTLTKRQIALLGLLGRFYGNPMKKAVQDSFFT